MLLRRTAANVHVARLPVARLSVRAFSAQPAQSTEASPAKQGEEVVLYKLGQKFTIRTMLSISCVNMFYWSSLVSNHYFFGGKIVDGIDLGGTVDPVWGYVGMAATGLIIYFTRHFAHHTVYQSYLSADQKRLGFQVHNLFGNPGRKFEVAVGKAKFLSDKFTLEDAPTSKSIVKSVFSSSLVPLRIEGIDNHVVVDREGLIRGSEATNKLMSILQQGKDVYVDSKEQRIQYLKSHTGKAHKKK